jgi:FKBP12-rapamycin complex-associated protein
LFQIDTASVQSAPLIPISNNSAEMEQSYEMSPSEMLVNVGTSGTLDDFYPSVAIAALMKIVRDPVRHSSNFQFFVF